MEYGESPIWNVLSEAFLRQEYPLDYEEQKRIKALGKEYRCPYVIPCANAWTEHIAVGFSFNQFPLEIQEKVKNKDVIDGGGFSGDSAMVFTEYGPRKVFTFEPNPDTIPIMKQVLENNAAVLGDRKDRIEIVPLALGKSKGTLTLYANDSGSDASATMLPSGNKAKAHEVDVISIDEFVESHSLDIGLIKLDVEGFEYDTILGAKETIIKQKPLLVISLYHTFKDFFEIKPLIESWEIGYRFEIRHHMPSVADGEFILMAYI